MPYNKVKNYTHLFIKKKKKITLSLRAVTNFGYLVSRASVMYMYHFTNPKVLNRYLDYTRKKTYYRDLSMRRHP